MSPRLRAASCLAAAVMAAGGCAGRRAQPRTAAARTPGCAGRKDYRLGFGRADITGPIAGVGMMGYGKADQKTAGLHLRLFSRAFVFASPCSGRQVAFASADLGQMFQGVREAVVARLAERFPGVYDTRNVMLSATHTHSGPGGYSQYTFYNVTTFGHDRRNFEAIVDGIVESIARAQADLRPGTLRLATGRVEQASGNRSPAAYALNPPAERQRYGEDVDRQMVLLRLDREDGRSATVNWFAVHGTSMSNENHLVSGDNKGHAALLFEAGRPDCAASPAPAVAAFAQSNAGDVSPNVYGGPDGRGAGEFAATDANGRAQYAEACRVYAAAAATPALPAELDYRQAYVKFDAVVLDGGRRTCTAAIGLSMLAGAEDGPGLPGLSEGITCARLGLLGLPFGCHGASSGCQGAKPLAVRTGSEHPPWTPEVLPVQVFRLGSVALVGVPFEITTMSGRRLRDTALAQLAPAGVRTVVIAALSNAYAGYVATAEEYALQHYEGASTHFGPWTLEALQQHVARLAAALASGATVDGGPSPRRMEPAIVIDPGPLFDALPEGHAFGDVQRDAEPAYRTGQTVEVAFWGGYPSNDFRRDGTFLSVEREEAGGWTEVARDERWETRLSWRAASCQGPCPPGAAASLITVSWAIPAGAAPGRYRIVHLGDARTAQGGALVAYRGTSRRFAVAAP